MKPVDVKQCTYLDSSAETNDQNPKFKIGEYQIIKIFFQLPVFQIGQKEFL